MSETSFDRASVIDNTNYLVDFSKDHTDENSKKPWWLIGITIGLTMNFLVFLFFYIYHKRNHLKSMYKER